MLVSAVIRSTLTAAIRPSGGDLRLYVFWLETVHTSVAITEFKGFRPLCTAQPDLDGVTDQFFRGDLFLGRSFLDLLKKLAGKTYVFSRHGCILLLLLENITLFVIVNAYKLSYTLPWAWKSVAPDLLLKRVCGKVIAWSRYDEIHPHARNDPANGRRRFDLMCDCRRPRKCARTYEADWDYARSGAGIGASRDANGPEHCPDPLRSGLKTFVEISKDEALKLGVLEWTDVA